METIFFFSKYLESRTASRRDLKNILTCVKGLSELFNIPEDTGNSVHAHLSQASLLHLINTSLNYEGNVVSLTPVISE